MNYSQEELFEKAWPYLAAAILRFGKTHNKEDIWGEIVKGKAQLHPLPHSGMLTSIESYPSGLKELRFWLAGGNLHEIRDYVPCVEAWSKGVGCTRSAIVGRPGWERELNGFKRHSVVLVHDYLKDT